PIGLNLFASELDFLRKYLNDRIVRLEYLDELPGCKQRPSKDVEMLYGLLGMLNVYDNGRSDWQDRYEYEINMGSVNNVFGMSVGDINQLNYILSKEYNRAVNHL